MRAPYTPDQLNYKTAPVRESVIGPRFWRVTLVKQGAPCGFKIWYGPPLDPVDGTPLDRAPRWQAELNGEPVDPFRIVIDFTIPEGGTYMSSRCTPVIKGEEIDAAEHEYLLQLSLYARTHDATMPEATPDKPVNLREMSPILPPRS